ncbi:GNAT family N-acetyltransferase [Pseudalkalibacillus caeni]|nr:GNAT family N-acetyltransferase [Pseudalkalibacillus caeni]
MKLKTYSSPGAFLDKVQRFLEEKEALNNLPLGIIESLVKKEKSGEDFGNPFLAAIEQNSEVIFVVVRTPPHNAVVYGDPSAIFYLVQSLRQENILLPGVLGPKETAESFASRWCELTGQTRKISMDQRIYKLTNIIEGKKPNGNLREATQEDFDLIAKWIYQFAEEATEGLTEEECKERAKRAIDEKSIYVWVSEGKVVSMANKARPTRNGATVNLVYTPEALRNKGYASACVTGLSQHLFDQGYKFCTLYTDLTNPTSNSIYMKIGYRPVGDSIVYEFTS